MNWIRRLGRMAPVGLVILWCSPARLEACATCFGRSDSPLAQGMNMGILVLLGVVLSVLAACVGFFVHVARRAARLSGEPAALDTGSLAAPPRR